MPAARHICRLLRARCLLLAFVVFVLVKLVSQSGRCYFTAGLTPNFSSQLFTNRRRRIRYESEEAKYQPEASEASANHFQAEASLKIRKHRPEAVEFDTAHLCPAVPWHVKRYLNFSALFSQLQSANAADAAKFDYLDIGGHYMPPNCTARHRVAIVVPYRSRADMLSTFPKYMHMFLRNQNIDYAIFVIEQMGGQTFNRGKLLNAGAIEALKLYDWQCFVFHDVDHFPVDGRNLYTCPQEARHMAVNIDKYNYSLAYPEYFGGVSAIKRSVFFKIDGFSNDFWGWGGEDDNLRDRLLKNGFRVDRYPHSIAQYQTVMHERDKGNPENSCRYKILEAARNGTWPESGLSNIRYLVEKTELDLFYTRIVVDLLEREALFNAEKLRREICPLEPNGTSTSAKLAALLTQSAVSVWVQ